jgi:regulator of protease activity HflC (stomatin/prohibitin superfamily)
MVPRYFSFIYAQTCNRFYFRIFNNHFYLGRDGVKFFSSNRKSNWQIKNKLFVKCSGIQVERVEVKDVRLPVQMQRAMATEAEAAREAKAKGK